MGSQKKHWRRANQRKHFCFVLPEKAERNLRHAKTHPPGDPQHQNKEIPVPEGPCQHCTGLTLPRAAPGMKKLGRDDCDRFTEKGGVATRAYPRDEAWGDRSSPLLPPAQG